MKANVIKEKLSDDSIAWNVRITKTDDAGNNLGIEIVTFHCRNEDDANWLRDSLHDCTIDVS